MLNAMNRHNLPKETNQVENPKSDEERKASSQGNDPMKQITTPTTHQARSPHRRAVVTDTRLEAESTQPFKAEHRNNDANYTFEELAVARENDHIVSPTRPGFDKDQEVFKVSAFPQTGNEPSPVSKTADSNDTECRTSKRIKTSVNGGFQSAGSLMLLSDHERKEIICCNDKPTNADIKSTDRKVVAGRLESASTCTSTTIETDFETRSKEAPTTLRLNLKVVGLKYYTNLKEILCATAFAEMNIPYTVRLVREPDNPHDTNAIKAVMIPPVTSGGTSHPKQIGHISAKQAQVLSPLMDKGAFEFSETSIVGIFKTTLRLRTTVKATAALYEDFQGCLQSHNGFGGSIDRSMVQKCGFAQRDLRDSLAAPYKLPDDSRLLAWDPTSGKAQKSSWPPSDDILAKLGLGGAQDENWWSQAGMLPPSKWIVHGAYDLVGSTGGTSSPPVPLQSSTQVKRTSDILDGAIHGATNAWSDDTLDEIADLMHSEGFWLCRKGESFIKVYGGTYVLGQKKDDLHVVLGARHQALTERICRGHNLVYTAVHLQPPAAPGFNTLIFGLNLSGSGFHYHRDSIGDLEEKNAPLLPKQPVVTTVFYENMNDSGKECVLWKPELNFSPRGSTVGPFCDGSRNSKDLYLAARALPTMHGQVHIQRAGLQKDALHGIFHTPHVTAKDASDSTEERANPCWGPRTGYRVAITARICHPDCKDRLVPYLGLYKGVTGPEGNMTLPRRR